MPELLTGVRQPYAWGSPTFIPELLGEQPTEDPQAELWLGAHVSVSATVGERSLADLIAEDPAGVVGPAVVQEFGDGLPFLLKVLAADQPLSLQAHPTREQAEEGHAREEAAGVAVDAGQRIYKDTWPKPELLCAMQDSEALCGFREPEATHALFAALGVPEALALVAPLADAGTAPDQRLADVFARLLQLGEDELEVIERVRAAAAGIDDDGDLGLFARTARELAERYPTDPGVLAALLMNRVALTPMQAVFLPAGNLHAYLRGGGIEVMANSDNVIRGGLTGKHVDVDELLAVLDFTPGFPGYTEPVEETPGCWRYPTPAPEFALWRLEPRESVVQVPHRGAARVLLTTDGSVVVEGGEDDLPLGRGRSALARSGEELVVSGTGTVFVAGPGVGG